MKADKYKEMMSEDDHLIGKYNKYPEVVNAARDAIHWCKIVAHVEMEHSTDVIERKKELSKKYKEFIKICDEKLNNAVQPPKLSRRQKAVRLICGVRHNVHNNAGVDPHPATHKVDPDRG